MSKARYRITWSKEPNEQGLSRVNQGPRGAILKVNGFLVARVQAHCVGYHNYNGWYWVARYDKGENNQTFEVPLKNTCAKPAKDLEVAKAECEAYVRGVLATA